MNQISLFKFQMSLHFLIFSSPVLSSFPITCSTLLNLPYPFLITTISSEILTNNSFSPYVSVDKSILKGPLVSISYFSRFEDDSYSFVPSVYIKGTLLHLFKSST